MRESPARFWPRLLPPLGTSRKPDKSCFVPKRVVGWMREILNMSLLYYSHHQDKKNMAAGNGYQAAFHLVSQSSATGC